jgi:hypothetical protein
MGQGGNEQESVGPRSSQSSPRRERLICQVGLHQVVMESGSPGNRLPTKLGGTILCTRFRRQLRGQYIVRILLAAIALLVLLGYSSLIVWSVPRVPLAVNANPVRGSVWTWLGPTIGADGTPLPASRATTYVNVVSAFGAHPDGATDNSSVFTMIFGDANGDTMFFPPGVYRLSCGHAYSASSSISLVGAGQGQSIIRFDTGCNLPYGGTFLWTNKSRVQLQNLTIDLNSPDTPSGGPLGIPVYIYATSAILGPVIDNIGIINRLSPTWELAIIAQSGGLITNPIVTNSYFSLMTAANIQNQCIALMRRRRPAR